MRECYPQFITIVGNIAIDMHNSGLSSEQAAVPGIFMPGSNFQFCAIYQLEKNFPVMVSLSSEINYYGSYEDQHAISMWCLRLVNFTEETVKLLCSITTNSTRATNVLLDVTNYFVKPIRNGYKPLHTNEACHRSSFITSKSFRMNELVRIYETLRQSCRSGSALIRRRN